jgi:hypothetical protein
MKTSQRMFKGLTVLGGTTRQNLTIIEIFGIAMYANLHRSGGLLRSGTHAGRTGFTHWPCFR